MKGKDIFLGLDYVGGDLIENAEYGQFPSSAVKTAGNGNKAPEVRRIRRPLLIAAIVALMLLLMGCAAAIVLHLDSFRLGEEIYVENMRYREDGSKIPATEKVKQYISMAGMEESKNYQADREWFEFTQSYDPDRSLWKASEGFEKPAQYNDYLAYTQEMLDKIDEICEKYGLKLVGDVAIFQQGDGDVFAQTLGIHSIAREDSAMTVEFGAARAAECGNFNASYNATLINPDTKQEYSFMLVYDYRDKAYFSGRYLIIGDGESVQQWTCTLPDGTEALIVSDKGGDAYILYDRQDASINISIRNVGWNWDSPGDILSREDMNLIAQSLDYSLKPNPLENIPELQAQLEQMYQARELMPPDPTEEAERMRLYEENEQKDNYADLICRMRDNEAYFIEHCNLAYENFWQTMEYTLLDVTGDGAEELILGRDGHIQGIWTIRDGKTAGLAGSYYEGYLCEGNIYEDYVFLSGMPYHWYQKLESDGTVQMLMCVEYDASAGRWLMQDYEAGTEWQTISEERAEEIIASFVRIPLEMKPVSEFPLK